MDQGAEHWRCPQDRFIPRGRRKYWCSYAPNASVEEVDEVIGAFSSKSKLPNKIADIAVDTISFIEMWTPPNVVPGHPGFELKLDRSKPENIRRSMVERGRELCAIRSYRVPRPVRFDNEGRLIDCGNYLFLRAFIGKKPEQMFHRGKINVAFIDGHVEAKWIEDLIKIPRPIDNPDWTRWDESRIPQATTRPD
jgi:prepilin-type processing-associated H-X9-DG protein